MRVMRKDFSWAVSEGVISEGQADELWRVLERRNTDRPRFDLPHVAYYFGALIVIGAMTWFMTLGWERFGGGGILAISLCYALGFVVAGGLLWRLLFPFVLSTAGLAIIALGILYAKNRDRIEGTVVRAVPTGIRRLLPMEREAR